MDRRDYAQPMDFTWGNGSGPVDHSSPFANLGRQKSDTQHPGTKSESSHISQESDQQNVLGAASHTGEFKLWNSTANPPFSGTTGSHSAFNSPSKPQVPHLRAPNNQQTFLFNTRNNNPLLTPLPEKPYNPSKDPRFNTPRKLEVDCSSGGETPDTGVDSEVNTPEYKPPKGNLLQRMSGKSSPTKDKKPGIFARMLSSPKSTSGRGAIAKREQKDMYSKKAEDKVRRRRNREAEKALARREDDSDDEGTAKGKKAAQAAQGSVVGAILTFVHDHPALPHILTWYLQLLFNGFLIFVGMRIIWSMWDTIKNDVDQASQHEIAKVIAEMAICADHYRSNDCEINKLPALKQLCENWKTCMRQDEKAIGRARVSAHTFAQIFNSFIEPISYKAMIFTVIIVATVFFSTNYGFNKVRHRAEEFMHQNTQQYGYGAPPATPQRFPSGSQQYYTPYTRGGAIEYGGKPLPSAPPGEGEGEGEGRRLEW